METERPHNFHHGTGSPVARLGPRFPLCTPPRSSQDSDGKEIGHVKRILPYRGIINSFAGKGKRENGRDFSRRLHDMPDPPPEKDNRFVRYCQILTDKGIILTLNTGTCVCCRALSEAVPNNNRTIKREVTG